MQKRELERRLSSLAGFESPRPEFEQYPTPAWLAAHLVHIASLQGDVAEQTVIDLGTGTGLLALAATTRGPTRVIGLERDMNALTVARQNELSFDPPLTVDWVLGDATTVPFAHNKGVTVLMNPPFGAQRGNEHADRAFLAATASFADVSYSIHNTGSEAFIDAFVSDQGGVVTHAFEATFAIDRQFDFHEKARKELPVEVYRIEWHPKTEYTP